MPPNQLAHIAVRMLALFLFWKAVESGLSQYMSTHYQLGVLTPAAGELADNPEVKSAIRAMWTMVLIGTAVPLVLALALWFDAPRLARMIVGPGQQQPITVPVAPGMPLHLTLLLVAGLVFIAVAMADVPKTIMEIWREMRRDPYMTWENSRVSPEVLLILGKVVVGGCLLVAVRKQMTPKIFGREPDVEGEE